MKNSEIKQKAISGIFWQSVQRFGSRIILLIGNLIFARLLSPADFGLMGIIFVFISFSDIIINGGFASALIQKKEPTQDDYSTVFVWNLLLSLICYTIIYFCAPYIAEFYNSDILAILLRVEGLMLFSKALCTVQLNKLQKELKFKTLAIIDIISSVIGCCCGISITLLGFGVWGILFKMLIYSVLTFVLVLGIERWIIPLKFSWVSFKELFNFGFFMFLSSFTNVLFINFQTLIIGKLFSTKDLGYYTQARKLEEIPVVCITNIVSSVSFPLFSILQEEKDRLLLCLRKNIKLVTFISFPLSTFLFVAANPIILFLFTDKWIESVVYFQLLCFSGLLMPINIANRDLFAAVGRSKLFFTSQLIYKGVGIFLMLIGIFYWGILGLLYGKIVADYFLFIMNSTISNRLVGYGTLSQIKDVSPNMMTSVFSGILLFIFLKVFSLSPIIQLGGGIIIFVSVYFVTARIISTDQYEFCMNNLKHLKKRKL